MSVVILGRFYNIKKSICDTNIKTHNAISMLKKQ